MTISPDRYNDLFEAARDGIALPNLTDEEQAELTSIRQTLEALDRAWVLPARLTHYCPTCGHKTYLPTPGPCLVCLARELS